MGEQLKEDLLGNINGYQVFVAWWAPKELLQEDKGKLHDICEETLHLKERRMKLINADFISLDGFPVHYTAHFFGPLEEGITEEQVDIALNAVKIRIEREARARGTVLRATNLADAEKEANEYAKEWNLKLDKVVYKPPQVNQIQGYMTMTFSSYTAHFVSELPEQLL